MQGNSLFRRGRAAASIVLLTVQPGYAGDALKLAPDSPDKPWPIPVAYSGAATGSGSAASSPATLWGTRMQPPAVGLAAPSEAAGLIDPNRQYDLAGLIDLAQRINPQTRDAWERARQAALAVGLVESTYVPQLTAEAIAGYQRTPLPIPTTLIPKGYFIAETHELIPSLAVKWLLFDFGRRAGAEAAARENAFVANVAFTGAHQKLIYEVSRDYFLLGAARGKRHAAEHALKTTEFDRDAVQARRANGLATVVEVAKAQRQVAQAQFNLARATGAEKTAHSALLASVGLSPTSRIAFADASEHALPSAPAATIDQYVAQALSDRPDILASLGKVRAARATLEKERAEDKPTVALLARGYQNMGSISTDSGPYSDVNKPGGAVFLQFSWPLFDGGRRDTQAAIAQAEVDAANDKLEQARNTAAKEVADAYYALATALAAHDAATELRAAARTAHDAALDAYRHGVGTYTSLVDDENALVQAETELEDARAAVLTAAAGLAFVTGAIGGTPGTR
jgi:outer membrane protein